MSAVCPSAAFSNSILIIQPSTLSKQSHACLYVLIQIAYVATLIFVLPFSSNFVFPFPFHLRRDAVWLKSSHFKLSICFVLKSSVKTEGISFMKHNLPYPPQLMSEKKEKTIFKLKSCTIIRKRNLSTNLILEK